MEKRGEHLCWLCMFWMVGGLYASFTAWGIIPHYGTPEGTPYTISLIEAALSFIVQLLQLKSTSNEHHAIMVTVSEHTSISVLPPQMKCNQV